jgi:hypothetical protein
MDGASLSRLRWRLHGAWMWPTFIVLTVLDGAIGHWLPPTGDSWSPIGAYLFGCFLSLVGIVAAAPGFGRLLRRRRADMPKVVARDYAGTGVVIAVTLLMLGLGLLHRDRVGADQRALQDALARAEAYIGDRAPAQFRVDMHHLTVYTLQPGSIYRTCVRNRQDTKSFCVMVNRSKPFARSVTPAGAEPNTVFAQGAW